MTTLAELAPGSRARIVSVSGSDTLSARLMEMGLIEGETVEYLGPAPLGDPLEFRVCGYRLSLRQTEARRVQVTSP
jgi:Fe2+ transport system protein FeoA